MIKLKITMETVRHRWILGQMIITLMLLTAINPMNALIESTNCTNVQCPPMSEINCPADSNIREYQESSIITTNSNHEIIEEVFVRCCVTQKCSCKTCNIPSCHNSSQVNFELVPETQTPGKCCGEYECIDEPNCSEIKDTNGIWLTDCQRCECVAGERICHRICDEMIPHQMNIACKSNNLNRIFMHGEKWLDDCYECQCVNGKEKCILPFCKSVECQNSKLVTLPGRCCPICMPIDENDNKNKTRSFNSNLQNSSIQIETTTPTITTALMSTTSSSSSSSLSTSSLSSSSLSSTTPTTTPTTTTTTIQTPPCVTNEPPVTYAIYTEVIEVIRPEKFTSNFYYIVIVILLILLVLSIAMNVSLWRKQRYYPVCSVDDNDSAKLKNIVYA